MSTRDDQRPSPEPVPESMIDAAEAPMVEAYADLNMAARVHQVDGLLAPLPR